jgi:ATP-dependent RNA helicase DHX29
MSATLDSKLFCSFFNGAPLLSVPGRTFPVANYNLEDLLEATGHVIEEGSPFAIREERNGEKASLWVTNRGGEKHKEVVDLVSQVGVGGVSDLYPGYSMSTRRSMHRVNEQVINYDLVEDVLNLLLIRPDTNDYLVAPEGADVLSKGSVLVFLPGLGEIRSLTERLEASRTLGNRKRFEVIPMHSTLSSNDQRKAFIPAKAGCRKIILSTNIAETSVTIPSVVCVIDAGRVREVRQNKRTSTSTLVTDWCSKASAKQRAGRAGRVQPGICLKLYSSLTANVVMKDASEPELRRVPLEEICLSILASGFSSSCREFLLQAPQPPSEESIQAALTVLLEVGAISLEEREGSRTPIETLTPLGIHLSKLPVDVRLGKMLIFGALFHCLDKVLTVAAALSSQSPFATFVTDAKLAQAKQKAFADSESDFLTLCNVWEAYSETSSESAGRKFCHANYLSHSALREIRDARLQFLDLLCTIGFVNRSQVSGDSGDNRNSRRQWNDAALQASIFNENGDKIEVIHAVLCAGLYPNVAHLVSPPGSSLNAHSIWHKQERLYFHSSSVNSKFKTSANKWIAFHEKFATPHRVSVSTTCFVHPFALLLFGGSVVVKHVDRKVIVDEWIEIGMAAQTGVLMRELRRQVNIFLLEMIQDVKKQSQKEERGATMVNGIVKLLVS